MKNSADKPATKLIETMNGYGLSLESQQAKRMLYHLNLVLKKNEQLNLTSICEYKKAFYLHLVDSLLYAVVINQHSIQTAQSEILDMGTGAGFPGIPLACVYPSKLTLLDSVNKKIAACEEFVMDLGLSERVFCVHSRLEEFGRIPSKRSFYDVVVARALAPLETLIEYATPLVKTEGLLVFSKGAPLPVELEDASYAANLCGMECVSHETITLPQRYGEREIFIYTKKRPSKLKLPRKVGEARRHPLSQKLS